jgi:formylglycine-generating enzyme required for sulfatase activity/uncharacterized protein (DUF362 family)
MIVGGALLSAGSGLAIGCAPRTETARNPADGLVPVSLVVRAEEPDEAEICRMADEVLVQLLGPRGLAEIVEPGDRVVIKVNNVFGGQEYTRGVITDPRLTRCVAEKVRAIIGTGGTANLKVIDATYSWSTDPSKPDRDTTFAAWRPREGQPDPGPPAIAPLDADRDGMLDGVSLAELVNVDSIGPWARFKASFVEPTLGAVDVYFPEFLRTRKEAIAAGEPDDYTDVLIGLPVLKSHPISGITCAVKSHYGLRPFFPFATEAGRWLHSGTALNPSPDGPRWLNPSHLDEYLVAMHRVRSYDLVITDCLTAMPVTTGLGRSWIAENRIEANALIASRDAIANDTVATLLGGVDPASVEYLERGRRDGVGSDLPEEIRVAGLTAFGELRHRLAASYGAQGKYPFKNDLAELRQIRDFDPPASVTVSSPRPLGGARYAFDFTAEDARQTDSGLARIELLVDGRLAAYRFADPESAGAIEADLGGLGAGPHGVRIAAWDRTLNCALSEERPLEIHVAVGETGGTAMPRPPVHVAERLAVPEAAPPVLLADAAIHGRGQPATKVVVVPLDFLQLTVLARSFQPMEYQWRRDGIDIPGADAVTLVVVAADPSDAGAYTCVVRNPAGSVETTPTLVTVEGEAAVEAQPMPPLPGVEVRTFAGIEFVRVPAGSFVMGSPDGEAGRRPNEGPQRTVSLTRGFWMSRCEVTKAQWQEVLGSAPWRDNLYASSDPDSPAECVSWDDARVFIEALNRLEPGGFRLPTEAEWEYACRAGSTTPFFFGDDPAALAEHAWYSGNTEGARRPRAHPVATRQPNPWGLHDMLGNVWEWCSDSYASDLAATTTAAGARWVMRGGAWYDDARLLRSAYRHADLPGHRVLGAGLRLCRDE